MARGVNKVILVGNLGADPETRAMPSGSTVANLRIATSESWRDKQTGEQQERIEWHRVALFGKLAEIASEYLRKGSQVYIEGSLRTRKWTDKQGNERYSTEIVGNEMQMLGGRGGGSGGGGGGGEGYGWRSGGGGSGGGGQGGWRARRRPGRRYSLLGQVGPEAHNRRAAKMARGPLRAARRLSAPALSRPAIEGLLVIRA